MNKLINVFLIITPLISFGLADSLSYYEKVSKPLFEKCDSLFSKKESLKDGEYNIYYDNDEKHLAISFNITDGNVNGHFRDWDTYGLLTTIGYYHQDSLWTFRNGSFILSDTTFKVGNWRYYSCLGPKAEWEKNTTYMQQTYEMQYNSDSLFHEVWKFKNGQTWKESVYHMTKGFLSEIFYYYEGNKKTQLQSFPNCTIEKSFEPDGAIKDININGKIEYSINLAADSIDYQFHYGEKYIDGWIENLYTSQVESNRSQERLFDSNGVLRVFIDYSNGIRLTYNYKGELLTIEEKTNRDWKTINKKSK